MLEEVQRTAHFVQHGGRKRSAAHFPRKADRLSEQLRTKRTPAMAFLQENILDAKLALFAASSAHADMSDAPVAQDGVGEVSPSVSNHMLKSRRSPPVRHHFCRAKVEISSLRCELSLRYSI